MTRRHVAALAGVVLTLAGCGGGDLSPAEQEAYDAGYECARGLLADGAARDAVQTCIDLDNSNLAGGYQSTYPEAFRDGAEDALRSER